MGPIKVLVWDPHTFGLPDKIDRSSYSSSFQAQVYTTYLRGHFGSSVQCDRALVSGRAGLKAQVWA